MNKKQRESTARLLYDLVRLSFTGLIIAGIIPGKIISLFSIIIGLIVSLLAFSIAYWLERKEE